MSQTDAFFRADMDGEQTATGAVLREALAIGALSRESLEEYTWSLADAAAEREDERTRLTYRAQWYRAFRYAVRRAQESLVAQEEKRRVTLEQKAAGHWAKRDAKIGWQ